jgi:cobalt-zinc-cadmium efflux system membrane fusion protein
MLACSRSGSREKHVEEEPAAEAKHEEEHDEAESLPGSVKLTAAAISEANIETWKVEPVSLEHLLIVPGNVGYDENRLLVVSASVRGRVARIAVDLGDRVAKGQPIAWLESVELGKAREDYIRAAAELRVAEGAFERARRLVGEKAISGAEFQSREADYLSRRAALQAAAGVLRQAGEAESQIRALGETGSSGPGVARVAVRSPFAGLVIDRKVTPGTLVEAFQPLVTIADLSSLWVFFQVAEKDLALLREGLAVRIRSESYPDEHFAGRVDFVGGEVDAATRTVRVRATVVNRGAKLKPGLFVKGHIEIPRPAKEAGVLAVPQAALQTLEGRPTVFVQTEPGTFVRRFVETGHTFEGFTEVLSGIRRGEIVVTEGSFVLKSEFAKATLADEH